MRLPVIVHLQAVFDSAQSFVSAGQCFGLARLDPAGITQCCQSCARIGDPQRRIASAVDQLMRLCKKLALTNAAMAALDIETRTELLALAVSRTNLSGHRSDVFKLPEIERLAPDKWLNGVEEIVAELSVACAHARTDEGCLLPRQRTRLIIADCRFDWQDNRADLR